MTFKRHFFTFVVAACLFVCAAPVHAVQFRMLGWSAHDMNLRFDVGAKPVETYVTTDTFSPVYEFNGEGPLVLYKRVEHDGSVVKQTASTVVIPPGLKQGLLLLIPGDDSQVLSRKVLPDSQGYVSDGAPLVYNYVWFDDSLEARPAGTIEFLNLSSREIAFQIEEHRHTLAPQAKARVPLVPGAKRMAFRAAARIEGDWRVFSNTALPTRGPERMMVILRDAPETEAQARPDRPNIRMISLYDWPATSSKTPAATVAIR